MWRISEDWEQTMMREGIVQCSVGDGTLSEDMTN